MPPKDRDVGRDFLRGAEISWYELGLHCDVDREKTDKLKIRVENELHKKRTVTVNLYHAPGAGGTTVARRVLWDLHIKFPSAILLRSNPVETVERLSWLSSVTGLAVLLLIDGAQIAERQVDELYQHLSSRQVPAVLLQSLRRFKSQQEQERTFYLPAKLSSLETRRFADIFSREMPQKRDELEKLRRSTDQRLQTPFYFGLQTFGKDFLGLESYVNIRLVHLTPVQKRILGFLALAHHYAQRPISAQAFAELLGVPRTRHVKLAQVLPEETLDLVVEVHEGVWRTVHDLIAQEILEQLLWPTGTDRRLWKQNLSPRAVEFAKFCRGDHAVSSEEMLELARRTFIYRDNVDLLGTERSALKTFAQLIEDISSPQGKVEVQRNLTELYPEEAHFWAHLGRLYAVETHDYKRSIICIDEAIQLTQGNDHVLHHMKGMALRYQIGSLIEQRVRIEEIVELTKLASTSFEKARELKPDDEHGYISEVQMLARVLDYAGRSYRGRVLEYLSLPNVDPFLRDSLERAEDLLEHVRRNREGGGASPYEAECRGKLDELYGHYDRALETWGNLLDRRDVYRPPLRRQIVWTYLARRGRSWDELQSRELERVVNLLEENLQEEPNNDKNLRLWVQAVRRSIHPPSIEAVIERVGYWKANSGTLDATYYLYVFHALMTLEGFALPRAEAMRYIDESRQMARFRPKRTKSLEWLGTGAGIKRLVHHSELGEWLDKNEFWEKTDRLARERGRIVRIQGTQAGQINVNGLLAFFVPGRGGYRRGYSENQLVDFYLGFSYDGLQAWEVKDVANE